MGLENITRFDYERTRGWWVRFSRKDNFGVKRVTSKLFSDATYGTTAKALKAAKAWRDRMKGKVPARRPSTARPTSVGYGYVYRGVVQRRGSESDVWIAWMKLADGRVAQTSASIEKWGDSEAKRRCVAWIAEHRQALPKKRTRRVER